jgi:carboxymethylenebutenolidase
VSGVADSRIDRVRLTAADGHVLSAVRADPNHTLRGGLVVVQDAYGLGHYIESVCRFYAENGWSAIAPAIYDRQQPEAVFDHSPDQQALARRFRANLIWEDVLCDIAAARAAVQGAGPVCILGFCVGGSAAWLAAARLELSAAACFYGKDIVNMLDERPTCPTILHFGDNDHLISGEDVERIRRAFPKIPVHVYPGGHGFDAARRPHEKESSEAARSRCLALFEQAAHIAREP